MSEKYVLSISSNIQRRRLTRLLPKIAVEGIRGWKLALISVGIAYMIGDVLISRETKWWFVMKSMEYLHGSSGVSGPGTIISILFFLLFFLFTALVCRLAIF